MEIKKQTALSLVIVILTATVLLLLTGCTESRQDIGKEVIPVSVQETATNGFLSVDDVASNRNKYLGQEISVSGVVEPGLAFEFVSEQPYRLKGGEHRLWVITRGLAPPENSFITVKGKLISPYQIKGRRYELVLLEENKFR